MTDNSMPEYEIIDRGTAILIDGFFVGIGSLDLDNAEVKKAICTIKTWIDDLKTKGVGPDDCTFTIDTINNKVLPGVEPND